MAAKKLTSKKTTVAKPAAKSTTRKAASPSQNSSTGFMDYFRFGESYTSLILGMVVVIIATILLVAFFKNRNIQEVNPQKDISATSISPAAQRSYTVKAGDTLWSIAESQLNDGYRWKEIMRANNISSATSIEKGTNLVIPSGPSQANPGTSQTPNVSTTPAPSTVVSRAAMSTPMPSLTMTPTPTLSNPSTITSPTIGVTGGKIAGSTYTVKEGDYLWDIAIRAYGDGYRWVEIAQKNNIQNPDLIFVGTVLKLSR